MNNIYGFTREALKGYFKDIGENPAKADIIFKWLYHGVTPTFRPALLDRVKADFSFEIPQIIAKNEDASAVKYLFRLEDENTVEAVIMKHDYGLGLCLSTQVGCNMGCAFCESGRFKKKRNLKAYEIVGQFIAAQRDLNCQIAHAVLMGIGEPLDNFSNSADFINIAVDPYGLNLGPRHVTLSTCGLIPGIKRFGELNIPSCLAISLHASNDEVRNKIMPVNKAYPIKDLVNAVKEYSVTHNKRVTFEYMLLKDINCSLSHADELIYLLKDIDCYVNLIPYNETSNTQFKRCNKDEISAFYNRLREGGIWVTVRREFGTSIKAACGQLRNEYIEGQS